MDLTNNLNANNNSNPANFPSNVDSIEQKLEQNEKIMQIYSDSLPHCHQRANSNVSANSTSDSITTEHFNSAPPILKLFAKQLLTLTKNCNKITHSHLYNRHPSLRIWLKLLNISQTTLDVIIDSISFHELYEKSDTDLKDYLESSSINACEQEVQLICRSFQNLKAFYHNLEQSNSTATTPSFPPSSLAKSINNGTTKLDNNNNTSVLLSAYSNPTYMSIRKTSSSGISDSSKKSIIPAQSQSIAPQGSTGSSSSSSELLDSSNSNESQLSSSSNSSIVSENKNNQNLKNKLSETSTKENVEPPVSPSTIVKKRNSNSESETIKPSTIDSGDLNEQKKAQNDMSSKLLNLSNVNSNQIVKNLTFSPILPIKTANSKKSGQKVTTPPPFRKLSTGSPYNMMNVNSHIHAAALAAATARLKAENSKNNETEFRFDEKAIKNSSPQSIHRSSSHESHLRNKIQPPLITNSNTIVSSRSNDKSNASDNKQSNSSCENIYRLNDGSDYNSSRDPSGQASPINGPSPTRKNANNLFSDDHFKNNNLSIPKSPKQFRDHRWSNTFKVADCGVCNKKMIIGIKCRSCKFRCHKECEKKFTPICSSVFMAFLPATQQNADSSVQSMHASSNPESNGVMLQSSSLISSSSSGGSSTLPSPALINNNSVLNFSQVSDISSKEYEQFQQQHSWPSGASKMARVANKIVNSINSVSTPKSNRKQQPSQQIHPQHSYLQHQQNFTSASPKNFFSNESPNSSCNSSGPNSPSFLKQQQQLQNAMNTDKKSSSSSTSISSGMNQNQQKQNYFNYNTQNLSPRAINNYTAPSPFSQNAEFFGNPTIKRTTSTESNKLDESVDSPASEQRSENSNANLNGSIASIRAETNENLNDTHEITSEILPNDSNCQLDLRQSNNSTVVDSNNEVDTDPENAHLNYSEYEAIEQDQNKLNFSQDLKQFNITYDEITDKVEIGRGRFGCVYKAQWHGPHAIKEIDFDENLTEESKELKNFKQEVLNLKKTRHANLILFVGACMKPPKCAIVMSLCRGVSLYKYLHTESYQKPNFDWTIDIATQIAQGMGYLHNKQMIHKDLRSKNIFIDGSKAVIADFGLYSITRLCKKLKRQDLLPITKECVYYMAPELVRLIGTAQIDTAFSQASDVFSFGTVWYELFCFEYPFQSNSTETVIYLIGNGLKNISPNIQIPKEFKNILLKCWSKDATARPNFSHLLETFRAIPKRTKLFRSPSHPVHIGRSLEALHSISALNDMRN